jgi:hypothetical protein
LTFNEARKKIQNGSPDIWKTNVAGIRENGKCRVVTSGSFYKDAFLQPFSHMTIEAVKSDPLLRDSLQAARLGYKFVDQITHLDHKRGAILFEERVRVMSFDWRKATDWPPHKSAHLTMGALFDKMHLPRDIKRDIFAIWPGKKDIYVNGKNRGQMVNGIPMGDPLTKTNISLAHPICAKYADLKCGTMISGVGAGNGDDGVEIKSGPHAEEWMAHFLAAAKQLGYELSEDDFFITGDWFTYCEEVARIPIDRFNTTSNAARLKDDRLSPYLDFPKYRLVIDTRKDRKDFSSDPKGKYTLLGKDIEYVRSGGQMGCSHLFNIASACQDVCLGLRYQKIPVYLPRQVFSIGKLPAGWNPTSWANALMTQKKHPRTVAYTAMRELIGEREPLLIKLRGVLSRETHFDKESYVEIKTIPTDDPIKKYRVVTAEQWKLFPRGVLERLRTVGRLVPESKIQALYLFQERVQSLNQVMESHDLFEVVKGMSIGLDDPSKEDLERVCNRMKDMFGYRPWSIASAVEEDLYPRNIVEILRKSDPLRVDLPEFKYLERFTKPLPNDSPLERALGNLEAWFDDNYENIIAGNEYSLPPTDIIEDDPIMILAAKRSTSDMVVLVTNDIKLWRLIYNEVPSKLIGRISVESWINHDADESAFISALKKRLGLEVEILVDQGAFETFLLRTDISPTRYPGWTENIDRSKVRSAEEIYDVYIPPVTLNSDNVLGTVKTFPGALKDWSFTLPRGD